MIRGIVLVKTLLWALALLAVVIVSACGDDDSGGGNSLDDGTVDTDTDTDTDVDQCTEIEWGSALTVDQAVANWTQNGYLDDNFDGVVEQVAVDFTLEDMNCLGFNSIVLVIGDTG